MTQKVIAPNRPAATDSAKSAYGMMLAADALIYALDSGRGPALNGLDIDKLRRDLETLRHAVAQA